MKKLSVLFALGLAGSLSAADIPLGFNYLNNKIDVVDAAKLANTTDTFTGYLTFSGGSFKVPTSIDNQLIKITQTAVTANCSNKFAGLITLPTGSSSFIITNNLVTTNTLCFVTPNTTLITNLVAVPTANLLTLNYLEIGTNKIVSWFIINQ